MFTKTSGRHVLEKKLPLEAQESNQHHNHAVAVMRSSDSAVVGHMPRCLLISVSWYFIKNGGSIKCEVNGHIGSLAMV